MNQELINWSEKSFSLLPWRKKRTLYRTLVSEIMLQQTTVSTVLQHFEGFIKKFPDVFSLAKASEEEVCIAWKGLGYYRRARNLRKAAISIVDDFDGVIPIEFSQLKNISGIGEYTANAILGIGANKKVLAVDANLERVLSRLFYIEEDKGPKLQKKIYELFENKKILIEHRKWGGRLLNEAFMDLGRVYCQAKKALCVSCPVNEVCTAGKRGDPLSFPINQKLKKAKELFDLKLLRVVIKKKEKILTYRKKENYWLAGQKEIPTFILSTNDNSLKQYPFWKEKVNLSDLKSFKTSITKYRITNYIYEMTLSEWKKSFHDLEGPFRFVSTDANEENLSTSTIKTLKLS
ncbi:MAG: A/G-specific adenine glycosylase [Bdellovibrionota bacterium]|nr:A/G-specific adenine glycosylase [Bdellovibrionota bacterium]